MTSPSSPFKLPEESFDPPPLPPFREPWNPGTIVLLTLFGGMLTGGLLLWRNLDRLGFRSGGWTILAVSVAYTVVVIGVGSYLGVERAKERDPIAELLRDDRQQEWRAIEELIESSAPRDPADPSPKPEGRVPSSDSEEDPPKVAEPLGIELTGPATKRKDDQSLRFLVRNLFAIGGVSIAWLLARRQFPRFRWAMEEGIPRGKLFFPALGAIAVSWVVEIAAVAIGVTIFMGM